MRERDGSSPRQGHLPQMQLTVTNLDRNVGPAGAGQARHGGDYGGRKEYWSSATSAVGDPACAFALTELSSAFAKVFPVSPISRVFSCF